MRVKNLLVTLLINHTGETRNQAAATIRSIYVPVVTAAIYFGAWGTILWTLIASAAYCSYLYPALQEYELIPPAPKRSCHPAHVFSFPGSDRGQPVHPENKRQTRHYQEVAEQLTISQPPIGTGPGASAPFRTAGGAGATLGRPGARDPQSARQYQGIGRNANSEAGNPRSRWRAELAGYISSEVNRLERVSDPLSGFRPPAAHRNAPAASDRLDRPGAEIRGGPMEGRADDGASATIRKICRRCRSMRTFASRFSSIWYRTRMRPWANRAGIL